ncbi:MAG TPA: S8 family serine peptidase [Candidatus Thermoplasmatota archaeon]|jgi:subtilisin family serine protease|nr:S8 family serine peptidase [Candidatus Thermoplasmatota archaeon]
MLSRLGLAVLALALLLPSAGSLAPAVPAAPLGSSGEVPTEIIVAFKGAIPGDADTWAQTQGGALLMRDDVLHWISLGFPDQLAADRALQAARLRADVRHAEHDGYTSVAFVPNDPLYGSQWGWPAISAPAAWDLQRGSHAVKVAVIDTGIDFTHPDLQANLCGPDISFVPSEPTAQDGFGHGTHVAGTIAAVTNNGAGVAGTSGSCLMAVKALARSGGGQWSWAAAAIRWAADNGADIESMSFGGSLQGILGSGSPLIVSDAVNYAYVQKGVLLVVAAGNSGCNGLSTVIAPAIYDVSIAVAALTNPGAGVAGFSSCGPKVEIAAPGAGVLSTLPACTGGIALCSNSRYGSLDGTSMATPHVSGVAALLYAQHAGITNYEARCILDLTATDLGTAGKDISTGWGRVDALKALQLDAQLASLGAHVAADGACLAGQVALGWAGGMPSTPSP